MFENPYDILSPEEAMEELRIGKNAIYTLLGSGDLKAFKVGRNWKIPRKSVDAYIDKNIAESETETIAKTESSGFLKTPFILLMILSKSSKTFLYNTIIPNVDKKERRNAISVAQYGFIKTSKNPAKERAVSGSYSRFKALERSNRDCIIAALSADCGKPTISANRKITGINSSLRYLFFVKSKSRPTINDI